MKPDLYFFPFLILLISIHGLAAQNCELLIWSDEFNGASLDTAKWNYDIGNGCPNLCGWGNNELQYYSDDTANVSVGNGLLTITAKADNLGGMTYSSGKITSRGKGDFRYGRMEARIRLPQSQGLWPAFWMLPTDKIYGEWPESGEIDIMELVGHKPDEVLGTIHTGFPYSYSSNIFQLPPGQIFADTFHVFSVSWGPDTIRWYMDDSLYHEVNSNSIMPWLPFQEEFHLILNVAVGGNFPGNPDPTTILPQVMEVDWVRVYNSPDRLRIFGDPPFVGATGLQYHTFDISGAQYNWTVPPGVTITSGQATPEIVLDWGSAVGDIMLELQTACDTVTMSYPGVQSLDRNITFQADMSGYSGSFTTVNVNGTFNGWCGGCNPLSDPDNDNIWTGTISLPDGLHEFKFTVDGWNDQENLASGEFCTMTSGSFTNRRLVVSQDTLLPVFCWESCFECGVIPGPGNVTFSVDMNAYAGTFSTVNVNGSWNGWCGSCNPLTDPDSNGIWETTLPLTGGSHEYKFTVDGWADQEYFSGTEACVVSNNGFHNRSLVVDGDSTLPAYCWNSCTICSTAPSDGNITFRVDMSQYIGSFTEVDVNGSWNNWCGTCNSLSDPDMDGIWTGTFLIPGGDHQYKFTVDGWTGQEYFFGGEPCVITQGGFHNRSLSVDGDAVLAANCFDACDPCQAPVCGKDVYEPNDNPTNSLNYFNGALSGFNDRRICPPGDEDWTAFQLAAPATIRVQLKNLPRDYELELYHTGGMIASSTNPGLENESIQLPLTALGTYYVRVFGVENAWSGSPYSLHISTVAPAPNGSSSTKPDLSIPVFRKDTGLESLSLYPNPTKGELRAMLFTKRSGAINLTITDLYGRQAYYDRHTVAIGRNTIRLDLNELAPGTYILNAQMQDASVSKKLLLLGR